MILPGHDPLWRAVFPGQAIPDGAQQPASVDLRLGNEFRRDNQATFGEQLLFPGDFILARTVETVQIPAAFAGRVEGKSSWGRRGLLVHATAGFLDPGFEGVITLEMVNVSRETVQLVPGVFICQISLTQMLYPVRPEHLYQGRYQGATTVEGAKP
jgi:dCTP deaminase